MNKSKKKNSRFERIFIILIVLALIVALGSQIIRLKNRDEDYQRQLANLEKEYEAETQRAQELIEKEEYMKTPQYIEDLAKSKLGLAYDNEIIFKESDE